MYNAFFLEVSCKGVLDCFACIFFAAVSVKEFELMSGLAFYHCEPTFKNFEDSVRKFIGNSVYPGVTSSNVEEGEYVFGVSVGDRIDLSANV